jgi:cytochrome P450
MMTSWSERQAAAREHAFGMPVEAIDPSNADYFEQDTAPHYFARLRRDDPVHFYDSPVYGPYWSITRYQDIMAVDTHHAAFSSDWKNGGIAIFNPPPGNALQMFIAMDPPKHDEQRKAVSPVVSPANLQRLQGLIRERTCQVLDRLPRGQTFNWVEHVSIELTTLMLATLFDFPLEDRRLLTYWSDVATARRDADPNALSDEDRLAELRKMLEYFTRLWNQRVNAEPGADLVSMLAHNPATRDMGPLEYMGNLVLLIVGGNDTTRNSMSGGLLALHRHPAEWAKLRANPGLIDNMVSEIIRWQTPLAHMRRTATTDIEVGGKLIRKGDKVVMWYLSGNRDDSVIADADSFLIDRPRARQHLSFGFGIHRCVGNRLAELQLRILWEEILARFPVIEIVGEPKYVRSPFVRGITELPVRIPA